MVKNVGPGKGENGTNRSRVSDLQIYCRLHSQLRSQGHCLQPSIHSLLASYAAS